MSIAVLRLFSLLRWAFFVAPLMLRDGLRRKEGFVSASFGTTPQALLAVARVSLGAQVVP
jgi:hypothetical protein